MPNQTKTSKEQNRKNYLKYRERHKEWNKRWIANNRERYNASKYAYRDRIKLKVLKEYARNGKIACVSCGIDDVDVLCIDHVNNNGAEHRKILGISSRNGIAGTNTYEALSRAGHQEGLQILCANCNMKKEMLRKSEWRLKNKWYKRNG